MSFLWGSVSLISGLIQNFFSLGIVYGINFDGSLDKLRQIDWVWFDKFVVYYYSTSSCCICQNLKMWYTTNKILFSLPPIFTTFQILFNRFSNFLNNEFLSNLNTSICYISSGYIESVCIDILASTFFPFEFHFLWI